MGSTLKIYIIGKTAVRLEHPFLDQKRWGMPGKAGGSKFEERFRDDLNWSISYHNQGLIEFAGRLCYESWDLPNESTATNPGYIKNIISQGHESVLEHVSVTFYVEGVSRNLSHELIRHRHLSFSELSQRFVDVDQANVVIPPLYREEFDTDMIPLTEAGHWQRPGEHLDKYRSNFLNSEGTRKQRREAARYVLPSGMETKFVVTGNLRAWRDVLKRRDSEHADAEMQLFAKEVKRQLLVEYPDVFKDLKNEDS